VLPIARTLGSGSGLEVGLVWVMVRVRVRVRIRVRVRVKVRGMCPAGWGLSSTTVSKMTHLW
jgi:hypothetical protein